MYTVRNPFELLDIRFLSTWMLWWPLCKATDILYRERNIRGYIQKFPDWVNNEINDDDDDDNNNNNSNKHSLRSNTKGYGGKIH
jgi:hypothetical protein